MYTISSPVDTLLLLLLLLLRLLAMQELPSSAGPRGASRGH
jgi:hypothetical protein